MAWLIAAIAYKRCFLYLPAFFLFKVSADSIALYAGFAVGVTDNYLVTGVHLLAVKAVNAEVMRTDKAASVVCIDYTVVPYLFGYGGWIFTEIP